MHTLSDQAMRMRIKYIGFKCDQQNLLFVWNKTFNFLFKVSHFLICCNFSGDLEQFTQTPWLALANWPVDRQCTRGGARGH